MSLPTELIDLKDRLTFSTSLQAWFRLSLWRLLLTKRDPTASGEKPLKHNLLIDMEITY